MITLISTPEYPDPLDPSLICRWLATECPNNCRLLRKDWVVTGANSGGFLQVTTTVNYTGSITNKIAVYCAATNQMYIGTVTNIDGTLKIITTDIPWVTGMNITYLQDNTLHGGYYFEGRLTVNGVVNPLTIIASPDSFGFADLDISGILRIATSLGKTADYTTLLEAEPTKSGSFTLEYRECWYGSSESYSAEGNTWYYAESVRSEEQGSNLHDYVADTLNDAPFFNQFTQPVYFLGLPFDLSFILPALPVVSPTSDLIVTIKRYNSLNTLLGTTTTVVPAGTMEGNIVSLNIDPAIIETTADHLTAEISI
jgi:hypothetical protein